VSSKTGANPPARSLKYATSGGNNNGKSWEYRVTKYRAEELFRARCVFLQVLGTGYSVPATRDSPYNALIFDKNSPLALVLLNLSISNSIASTGDSGFSTFRSTQIRDKSSRGISNSSLRVPDR